VRHEQHETPYPRLNVSASRSTAAVPRAKVDRIASW
jgi:hypothetical protein